MEKKLVALVFITLLAGLGGGYVLGFLMYQPQISELTSEISKLRTDIVQLNTTLQGIETDIEELKMPAKTYLPGFNVFDVDYNPGYSDSGFGGRWCKVSFNVQNFGNGTATNIEIDVRLELEYNEANYIGNASTTLSHLEPYEVRHFSIKVEQELYSNRMQAKIYHFDVSCQEGVEESFTLYPGD